MPNALLRRQEVLLSEVMFELFDFDVHEAGFSKHFEGEFSRPHMVPTPVRYPIVVIKAKEPRFSISISRSPKASAFLSSNF